MRVGSDGPCQPAARAARRSAAHTHTQAAAASRARPAHDCRPTAVREASSGRQVPEHATSRVPPLPRFTQLKPIKRAMGKICGSAGPGGHFCSMKLGHLGDCVIVGLELKCEPTQKRERETAPQANSTTAGKKRPKSAAPSKPAAAPSRPAAAEMTTPAPPKPVTVATKDTSAIKTKLAAKPKAARAARPVWVCGTAGPLGWRIQGTSSNFCTKKHGHLGNCFED